MVEIIAFVVIVELSKALVLIHSTNMVKITTGCAEEGSFKEKLPAPKVRSVFIWKICLALELEAELFTTEVTEPKEELSSLNERDVPKDSIEIPIVHSVMIYKMCEALDLKAQLVSPGEDYHDYEHHSTVPTVHSEMIYKMCEGLGIKAELAI
ncbi:hypothetical protein HNY73_013458 [Argiope bruennichi]|uniref:Uncharacterized protein n=1 Tax=Argiope bruennichi TaxID=94029 RepID=A0A8T0EY38_ARGBR|nr:hypothetical protein HNY73_013458 [Argiope bruennichi]